MYMVQIFYATIGASANVGLVVKTAPVLFLFSFIALAAHLALILGLGRLAGFSQRDLLLASNANIGGKCYLLRGHSLTPSVLTRNWFRVGCAAFQHLLDCFLCAGPSTVAGMAAAKGWRSSLVPGILTSTLGYAIGTLLGMWLGGHLRRIGT